MFDSLVEMFCIKIFIGRKLGINGEFRVVRIYCVDCIKKGKEKKGIVFLKKIRC